MTYITNKDWFYEVSVNRVAGAHSHLYQASAISIESSTLILDPNAGFMIASTTLEIVSDDADDNGAGDGARTIILTGLDSSYLDQEETITMTGLTPVTTINNFTHLIGAKVVTAGVTEGNQGTLTFIQTGAPANVLRIMEPLLGATAEPTYVVPGDRTARVLLLSLNIARTSGGGQGQLAIYGQSKEPITDAAWVTDFISHLDSGVALEIALDATTGPKLVSKTKVRFAYLSSVRDLKVTVRYAVIEEEV